MSPQQIIAVCEANWEGHKSDCSGFVKAVSAALGVNTFQPDDNADSIIDKLRAGSDWAALGVGNGPAAKAQADAGLLVVAGLKGVEQVQPDPHGHVVVVVTGPLDVAHVDTRPPIGAGWAASGKRTRAPTSLGAPGTANR